MNAAPQATENVDPSEIAKFSALAHRWWDPHGEFRPLHEINPLRLGHIERLVGGFAGKRVLDVGCGGGILAEAMAAKGAEVTGIDLAEKPLKVAMLHRLESGSSVEYRHVAVEALAAEAPEHFDVVTCMEMLEHVPDPGSVVASCARLAKPGGWAVFSTINRNPKSFLFAIVGAEYVLRLLPRGTHEYARFITPSELARHCRDAGLSIADVTGMTYNPLTRIYSLGRDADVNYILACIVDPVPEGAAPRMIDAVLFDLDGTLVDTAPDMARTVNEMCARRGLPAITEATIRPHVSRGARGMIFAAFGVDPADAGFKEMRDEFLNIYEGNLCIDSHLFPGMSEVLDWLEKESIAWGVVTNKFARLATPIIDALGLADRARVVVGGDTCARAKPFPDPLLHAAGILGVAPARTLYVGDDERDVQAARAAGMPVLAAGYGYLGDGPPPSEWGSDGIITGPAGVKAWIHERSSKVVA